MPLIPLVIVWQVFGRSASFALGWATSLFFGQIPGNKGRVVSAAGVISLAWVLLLLGVGPLLGIGILGERAGLFSIAEWDVDPDEVLTPLIGIVALPPLVTLMGETSRFHEEVSLARWARSLPRSYPIALSLGTGLLLMVVITPVLQLRRVREGRSTQHLPMLVREGRFEELVRDVTVWLEELTGRGVERQPLEGVVSWPLRALRYAAAQFLRSVVRDEPVRLRSGDVEIALFATDLSVTAPKDDVYRVRAALHKRLALTQAYLTWSEAPQRFEEELMRLHEDEDFDLDERIAALAALQDRIDQARIKSDEWGVLYRLRLQVERDSYERVRGRGTRRGVRSA